MILALVVAFFGSMQTFLNVATWVYLSGIFPLRMRGVGIGVAAFANWSANRLLAPWFPALVAATGITGTFFMFAAVGALAVVFVATQLPETRGRTLEALEMGLDNGTVFARR